MTFEKFKKMNMQLRFPKDSKPNDPIDLFNCHKCGFHQKVMSKMWIDGYEEEFILQFKEISPTKEILVHTIGKGFKRDGELKEELTCGMCGSIGRMLPVPEDILDMFGVEKKKKPKKRLKRKAK